MASVSDHSSILLDVDGSSPPPMRRHRFRFGNALLQEEEVNEVVEEGWWASADSGLCSRTRACGEKLDSWGCRIRSRTTVVISKWCSRFELLHRIQSPSVEAESRDLRTKINQKLVQEEAYWRQRAKTHCLKDGDSNMQFFHASATTRRKRNTLRKLH